MDPHDLLAGRRAGESFAGRIPPTFPMKYAKEKFSDSAEPSEALAVAASKQTSTAVVLSKRCNCQRDLGPIDTDKSDRYRQRESPNRH